MLDKLRSLMLGLNAQANSKSVMTGARRLVVSAAKVARTPENLLRAAQGCMEVEAFFNAEHATWIEPAEFAAKIQAGTLIDAGFDACDLRCWLALAQASQIPYIPAREILSLTEDEINSVSPTIELPDVPALRKLRDAIARITSKMPAADGANSPDGQIDAEAVKERIFAAMDDVPEGWMVRSARCGSSDLKALAMLGIAQDTAPEVRFGPDLMVGPGWVRIGNRRMVNTLDNRIMHAIISGPGGATFLARPWQTASRYCEVDDPHRAGTPIAEKGKWPCEWRAIVENGQVVAVSSYYGWCEHPTPEAARAALAVRDRAQAIVDLATRLKAWPRYVENEHLRNAPAFTSDQAFNQAMETRFGREMVSCTLDFIETDQGPMLLEGGPAVAPTGGAHPCAFAGVMRPQLGAITTFEGVAFRTMPHVTMADMATWTDGDRAGCILSFDEVQLLAHEELEIQ